MSEITTIPYQHRNGSINFTYPAASTGALVADVVDGGALGPLCAGVEACGQFTDLLVRYRFQFAAGLVQEGTHGLLNQVKGHVSESLVLTGCPRCVCDGVDVLDHVLVRNLLLLHASGVGRSHCHKGKKSNLPHVDSDDDLQTLLRVYKTESVDSSPR